MSAEESNDLKAYFDKRFNSLDEQVDKLSRGIYGEEDNESPGVMKRLKIIEIKVAKVFNFKNRIVWIGTGVAVGVSLVWKAIEILLQ